MIPVQNDPPHELILKREQKVETVKTTVEKEMKSYSSIVASSCKKD